MMMGAANRVEHRAWYVQWATAPYNMAPSVPGRSTRRKTMRLNSHRTDAEWTEVACVRAYGGCAHQVAPSPLDALLLSR